ncbi:hypothetical protein F5878DRAFT_667943 [Lentinula raphanica]|uniref:Uncharacterized protein n=1 Tax=Lentinula raphanica TaxID=153919 RepID=A0AA38NUW5_9AGAR|nr:hypothetical protein F5878DRAFT_667943 [Lentinula raphanica]
MYTKISNRAPPHHPRVQLHFRPAPPYATLDPPVRQRDLYPPRRACYRTAADSKSFNTYFFHPSTAPHTAPISSQDVGRPRIRQLVLSMAPTLSFLHPARTVLDPS